MIKTASLIALFLGIVLDIQGCGASCPKNDSAPTGDSDCNANTISACMASEAVTDAEDACKGGEALNCCLQNCCDASYDILPGWFLDQDGIPGDAAVVADVMEGLADAAKELKKAMDAGAGELLAGMAELAGVDAEVLDCKFLNPC